jgi:hypothetical protein
MPIPQELICEAVERLAKQQGGTARIIDIHNAVREIVQERKERRDWHDVEDDWPDAQIIHRVSQLREEGVLELAGAGMVSPCIDD